MRWFRQRGLWSYRADIFLFLVSVYTASAVVIGSVIVTFNIKQFDAVPNSQLYHEYIGARSAVAEVSKRVKDNQLSDDDQKKLQNIADALPRHSTGLLDARLFESALATDFRLNVVGAEGSRSVDWRIESSAKETLPILARAYSGILILNVELLNRLSTGSLFLGKILNIYQAPFFLLSILGVLLMAYYIQNVFYTRTTYIAFRHPDYPLLFLQLSFIAVLPFFLMHLIEIYYQPRVERLVALLADPAPGAPPIVTRVAQTFDFFTRDVTRTVFERLVSARERAILMSTEAAALLALTSWISGGLWVTRRLGGGAFLTCSICCIIAATALVTAIRTQPSLTRIGGLIDFDLNAATLSSKGRPQDFALVQCDLMFLATFFVGVLLPATRWRPYLICAGYLGVLAVSPLLLALIIGLPPSVGAPLTFLAVLVAVIVCVSAIEAAMRRCMFGLLYEPQ